MIDGDRSLAILTGASSWPNVAGFEESDAFSASAKGLRDYLLHSVPELPEKNVLWLFDEHGTVEQYERIHAFLEERLKTLGAQGGANVTLFVAYIGHGNPVGGGLRLLLRDTRSPLENVTSFDTATLSGLLRAVAPQSRRIILLDCCFAGAATQTLMSSADTIMSEGSRRAIGAGDKGVSLLCASSSKEPARLDLTQGRTMFTGALVDFLREGDPRMTGELSIRQVCEAVAARLDEAHGSEAPRPEVHSPRQVGRDLADAPMFLNPAAPAETFDRASAADLASLRSAQQELLSALARTWKMIYPRIDCAEPIEIASRLASDGLIDRGVLDLVRELLELSEQSFDGETITREQAMRLIHFDTIIRKSLRSTCFQNATIKALESTGWSVEFVVDPQRRKRAWLFDLLARRGEERLLVAPKTAMGASSSLLDGALKRIARQTDDLAYPVLIVVPDRSKSRAPDDAGLPVYRFTEFTKRLSSGEF